MIKPWRFCAVVLSASAAFSLAADESPAPVPDVEIHGPNVRPEQNYAAAQYNLGVCYEQGKGVAKDQVEAVKWYRKAAEQNDAEGQLYLGLSYVKGEGVAEDLVEAYKWLLLAARQGDESAKKIVTNPLESSLRPEQIAEGQKRAREFKPR